MTASPPGSPRYWLNRAVFDLGAPENLAAFRADSAAYVARYPLDEAAQEALGGPRWQALIDCGLLPNLVFKYYLLQGLPPERFAEIVGGQGHG